MIGSNGKTKSVAHEAIKKSDINLAKKDCRPKFLCLIEKSIYIISLKVISYLQQCFPYAIKLYKNDLLITKGIAQKIVPNCFEDQVKFDEKTCKGNFDISVGDILITI